MISPTSPPSDENVARYRAKGWWAEDTLDDRFRRRVAPDALAIVDGEQRVDFAELDRRVDAVAMALTQRGVGRGDVVGFLLPNWWEAVVIHLATARIGAVSNPLHTIYRQRELRFVLAAGGARIVVAAASHRDHPYADFVREAAAGLDHAIDVVEARGDGSFEEMAHTTTSCAEPQWPVEPSDILLLMYTSGTTSTPKGVLHSHETMLRAGDDLADLFGLDEDDVMFVPSPMTHVTGLLYLQVALGAGMPSVLLDRWDPAVALDLVRQEGCTYVGGATPFIQGLVDETSKRGLAPSDVPLTRGTCGGADVPPFLIDRADVVLGARFVRVYGLTEGVTVTASRPNDEPVRRGSSDGRPLPGMRLRIAGPMGDDVAVGDVGEIQVLGPANFLGYLDSTQNKATFTEDGWVRTGDLGRLDERGDLHVTGRMKDIIIRGGENIAVREVEDLLLEHVDISQVAVVAMPDPDLGERACAFVVPSEGASPTLDQLVAFLRTKQIAPQKYPERLVVLAEGLPTTHSGKIQKYKLRQHARELTGNGA